jgi:hypothetical protein
MLPNDNGNDMELDNDCITVIKRIWIPTKIYLGWLDYRLTHLLVYRLVISSTRINLLCLMETYAQIKVSI